MWRITTVYLFSYIISGTIFVTSCPFFFQGLNPTACPGWSTPMQRLYGGSAFSALSLVALRVQRSVGSPSFSRGILSASREDVSHCSATGRGGSSCTGLLRRRSQLPSRPVSHDHHQLRPSAAPPLSRTRHSKGSAESASRRSRCCQQLLGAGLGYWKWQHMG